MKIQPRRRGGKTALVLAGGGLTGAVYEIGALRAIDDLLVDRSVNDFDIYVGTSAGALVGACLANGFGPEELMQIFDASHPEVEALERRHLFSINTGELLHRAIDLPYTLLGAWSHYLRHINDMTMFDFLWSLLEALPTAIYDGKGLESYMRRALTASGRSNSFKKLDKELAIIATDLDTGQRVVFANNENNDVPISLAVAASSALPLVYKPVRIDDREYVDGALGGTASLDLAVERGAELIICINPLVPFDNSKRNSIPFLGVDGGHLSEKGVQAVATQVMRIMMQSGLRYHIKQLRRAYPDVDIILIEPRPDDYQMSFYNVMRYSARRIIAEHGFETVALGLAEDYTYFNNVLARHNVPISRKMALAELEEIKKAAYDPEVIKRVLERRSYKKKLNGTPSTLKQLNNSLAELDLALDAMGSHSITQ